VTITVRSTSGTAGCGFHLGESGVSSGDIASGGTSGVIAVISEADETIEVEDTVDLEARDVVVELVVLFVAKLNVANEPSEGKADLNGDANPSKVFRHRLALSLPAVPEIDLLMGEILGVIGAVGRRHGEGETSLSRLSSITVSWS
jgi:hypothetical protein